MTDPAEDLCVSSVRHMANITVDERGSEASAATVIAAEGGAAPLETASFSMQVDRPFVWIIEVAGMPALIGEVHVL